METRLLIAYTLLLAMTVAAAAWGFYLWHNARDRSIVRQRLRDQRASDLRKTEREDEARARGKYDSPT